MPRVKRKGHTKRSGVPLTEWTRAELRAELRKAAPVSATTGQPNQWAKFKRDGEIQRELERRGKEAKNAKRIE